MAFFAFYQFEVGLGGGEGGVKGVFFVFFSSIYSCVGRCECDGEAL